MRLILASQSPYQIARLISEQQLGQVYDGIHETDALCALNASKAFKNKNIGIEVLSVGAFYGNDINEGNWTVRPRLKATSTRDILKIVNSIN